MDEQARVIHRRKIPARKAQYAKLPSDMSPELGACLEQMGISRLYSHQAQMFEAVRAGEDVVITTSTASGKTLSFLLPVLESLLEDPSGRAVFLYPTKALAADQLRALKPFLSCFQGRIEAGVYDGDTPAQERSRIRRCANLILTNADMLNASFLPNHSSYGFDFIFSHLKFVVIDELHSYRGAFGSHLANLFRRLERICRYYQAGPQFLCSSATIANPAQLASLICGRPFRVIDQDGSPAPEKEFIFLQPPPLSPASNGARENPGLRMSAAGTAACLLPDLVREGRHFIAFAGSRRNVEVILREARDRMETEDMARRIAGYRSGYTPAERRQIERKMADGELSGLVSTNALELGIDIGALDTTVLAGYPGTCASFWQQTGRAGRRNGAASCVNHLILMTFTDLLEKAACLLSGLTAEGRPFSPEWIIIDEAQDVDPSQLAFLEALYGEKTGLFAVGDPNQVIYSWRGGTENMFFRLKNRFQAKELPLSINYRSNGVILEAAGRFRQFGGELAGCRERGERIAVKNHYNPFQEAEYLAGRIRQLHEKGTAYGQTAGFYRLQEQAELLERVFEREGIPFETAGSRSVTDIPALDWLVRLLRAACAGGEELFRSVVSDRRYGIGEPLEERIRGLAGHVSGGYVFNRDICGEHISGGMDGAALYEYLLLDRCLRPARAEYREEKGLALGFLGRLAEQCAKGRRDFSPERDCMSEQDFLSEMREFLNSAALCGFSPEEKGEKGTDRVRLMTLHASKGLEFSQVFLIGVNQGLIPLSGRSFEEKEEERRLFFVGMTRARDRLELSYYTDPAPYRASGGPGSYLRLLPASLLDWKEARTQEEAAGNLQRLRRAVMEQRRGMKEKEAPDLPGGMPDTLPGGLPGGEGRAVEKAGKRPEEKTEKNPAENTAGNTAGNPAPRRVRHPRYGVGVVAGEDESMIRVEFEGYGSKTFMKAFSGLTEC